MENKIEERLSFWNNRAKLGFLAGSNDGIAKGLEMEEIQKHLKDGMKILEIGCGNGVTAIEFVKNHNIDILGIDYAEQMVVEAQESYNQIKDSAKGKVKFAVMKVQEIDAIEEQFDMIYCERVLINLDSWDEQKDILVKISKLLKEDGIFCMCENSMEGLSTINSFREKVDLEKITPPWHNRYLLESELEDFSKQGVLTIVEKSSFTSTYYFLSRVVNAWQAKQNGEEPSYDSIINKLAIHLPSIGDFGQTKLWVWKRARK